MEELHFGRAARRLHIAQPPLSQAVIRLENELGVALLQRTSRVVTPTPAGDVFAEEARKLLAELDLAVAETRRAGGATLPLRIGCVPDLTIARTRRFLDLVRERNPESGAEVTHLLTHEQVARLRDGDLDIGIVHGSETFEGIESEPIFEGTALAALVPVGHPLAGAGKAGPDELRGRDVVMFPREADEALYDEILASLARAAYELGSVRDLGGTSVRDAMIAVAERLGVAIGPFWPERVREGDTVVACVSLDPVVRMPDAVIAWRAGPRPRLRAVIDELRVGARELRRRSSSA